MFDPILVYKGKSKDCYDIGYNLLAFVHSDRISAFDQHICQIDNKGHILNQTNAWWMSRTDHIIKNHMVYSQDNILIAKKCRPFKIEVIVRGYITGNTSTSIWTQYENGVRTFFETTLPDGLTKFQKLDEIILTPTTKEKHDKPITSYSDINNLGITYSQWTYITRKAIKLLKL